MITALVLIVVFLSTIIWKLWSQNCALEVELSECQDELLRRMQK